MKYKLVALDLDGTLLSDGKELSHDTKEVISEARDKGVLFTIATGRMFKGAVRYAEQLNIDIPIITYNGAIIKDPITGKAYREYKLPADYAIKAIKTVENEPLLKYVFSGEDVFTDTNHKWTDNYAKILEVEIKLADKLESILDGDPVMVVFMVQSDMRLYISDILRSKFDSQVRITNSSDWFVDILHPQASKGLALNKLAGSLGVERDEVIAMGDNLNDLEMIEYAGLGIAVANASTELKTAADYVAKSSFNIGVDEAIQKFCL